MAGLKQTTEKLARYRRQFDKIINVTAKAGLSGAQSRDAGRLRDVTGFGSNPGNLRMRTYAPDALAPGAPLVVVLHGCTQTADGYDSGAGWSTLADRYGFALLLPEQQRANNANTCFNWFVPQDIHRDSGEALSIRQMIERIVDEHQLDRSRAFVTGLSAGGAMTAVMLATYQEVFAGGAIIAGLPYGTAGTLPEALESMFQGKSHPAKSWGDLVRRASPHAGPWPKVSIWHGSSDSTVQPVNADELVKQWTDIHDVGGKPSLEDKVDGYPHRVWRDASGEALVESFTITGMAHGTPIKAGSADGETGTAGPFILEAGISSSYRIATFWGLIDPTAAKAARATRDATRPSEPGKVSGVGAGATERPPARPSVPLSRRRGPTTRPAEPEKVSAFDPGAIISKALKKAGLLKG